MNRALRDAQQHRREREQQRLQNEKLQRGEDLAGGHDAKCREQKQRAGQCIEGEEDGRAVHCHSFRFPTIG